MTDADVKRLRGAVKEEIGTALKPVNKKLDILWEQVEKVTFGLEEVKETLDSHSEALKRIEAKVENNSDDTHKLNKRVVVLEAKNGIVSPPELSI